MVGLCEMCVTPLLFPSRRNHLQLLIKAYSTYYSYKYSHLRMGLSTIRNKGVGSVCEMAIWGVGSFFLQ